MRGSLLVPPALTLALNLLLPATALAQLDQPSPTPSTAPAPPAPPPPAADREEPRRAFPAASTPMPADGSPVVRAAGGDLGIFFRFGGLANLFATGNSRSVGGAGLGAASGLIVTQAGLKLVPSEHWRVPISVGTGIRLLSPDLGDSRADWGLDLGIGFEYHFRIWRRISPFVGMNLGLGFADPSGDDNLVFGVGLGPSLGVEYYIGDRVSLSALYQLVIQVEYQQAGLTAFSFATMAGGAMTLTYYF